MVKVKGATFNNIILYLCVRVDLHELLVEQGDGEVHAGAVAGKELTDLGVGGLAWNGKMGFLKSFRG